MSPLKFLVDACVDVRLMHWLRERGYDAKHLREENLQKLPNGQIFIKATAEDGGLPYRTRSLPIGTNR